MCVFKVYALDILRNDCKNNAVILMLTEEICSKL